MPNEAPNEKKIQAIYRLADIKDVEFYVKELPEDTIANFDNNLYLYNLRPLFVAILNSKQIDLTLGIECYYQPNAETKETCVRYTVQFNFIVENIEDFTIGKIPILPDDFWTLFLSIGISTARGILREKLKTFFVGKVVLPLIDPNAIFQQYKAFQMEAVKKQILEQQKDQ